MASKVCVPPGATALRNFAKSRSVVPAENGGGHPRLRYPRGTATVKYIYKEGV